MAYRFCEISTKIKVLAGVLISLFGVCGSQLPVQADGDIEIYAATGLREMADNPSGSYILMDDIDMEGEEWTPFAFHGTLDGNGHAILNLSVRKVGAATRETYDGNMKVYDTSLAAMFDVLSGRVENLTLLNLQVDVESDQPCFVGGIAGYLEHAEIADCNIEGKMTLRAHDKMFGVGGVAGYGYGQIVGCDTKVTLVCIDTDSTTRDEQFMGGVCAAGYPDVTNCNIRIDGYASEHGYAHNGGLIGMYILYPRGTVYTGAVTGNRVEGKITFYEDNTNRRAYCAPYIGEIMNWTFAYDKNKESFLRDEVYVYDVDLLPRGARQSGENDPEQLVCGHADEKQEIIPADCNAFGYTKHTCETCGYVWNDTYTLKQHDYVWTVEKQPLIGVPGAQKGVCTRCGAVREEPIEELKMEQVMEQMEPFLTKVVDHFAEFAKACRAKKVK